MLLCRFPHHQFCDFPNFNLFANDPNSTQIYRATGLCCSLEITVNVWNSLFLSERLIISIKPKIIRYYNVPLNKFSTQLVMFSLIGLACTFFTHQDRWTVNRIISKAKNIHILTTLSLRIKLNFTSNNSSNFIQEIHRTQWTKTSGRRAAKAALCGSPQHQSLLSH